MKKIIMMCQSQALSASSLTDSEMEYRKEQFVKGTPLIADMPMRENPACAFFYFSMINDALKVVCLILIKCVNLRLLHTPTLVVEALVARCEIL